MAEDNVRRPTVAGSFYEGTQEGLVRSIEGCYATFLPGGAPAVVEDGPRKIIGLVSPHAGYTYSGPPAARGFAALAADGRPDVFVILGPNHGRAGTANAIQTSGYWESPLGRSPIHEELAARMAEALPHLSQGPQSLAGEHSLEVQLPFIQHLYGTDAQIVPIMIWDQSLAEAQQIGDALAGALQDVDAVIIASTDMTHFESAQRAAEQDDILVRRMLALDPEGLLRERQRRGISMCGYGPVAAMLIAAKQLGAGKAQLLDYTNSGAVTGLHGDVVAYLSLTVSKP